MSKRLNLTPQEMIYIINSIGDMKNVLSESTSKLQRDTVNIKRHWDDDQFDVFQETIKDFIKQLNLMCDRMEVEKQRLIRFQQEAQQIQNNFGKE